MEPLATIADITARGVTVSPDEETAVNVYLDVASAAVRQAAGCPISSITDDVVVLLGTCGKRLTLPGPPVTSVSSVLLDGESVTDYSLRGGSLWRSCGWQGFGEVPSEITVTYTHGFPAVPSDVVDMVCRMAVRALVALRDEPDSGGMSAVPIKQESVGDYSVTYAFPQSSAAADLPSFQRNHLASRFGGGPLTQVVSR